MATPTLSTRVSRRTMLAVGGAAVAASGLAAPPVGAPAAAAALPAIGGGNDARLSRLAGAYGQAQAALGAWIDVAERHLGPLGYIEPPYHARYRLLCARTDALIADLARTRPDSIAGLAVKMRAGIHYDYAGEIPLECDERLLAPILDDLDRLAAGA